MKKILAQAIILMLPLSLVSFAPCDAANSGMKIRLKVGDKALSATLIDSATTRDFISLLPLTLTFGDITYYAPWGNLAIFYRDLGGSSGLVILGRIDSGMEALNVPGSVRVTIELIK